MTTALPASYSELAGLGKKADKAAKKATDFQYAASVLPYQLKEEFDKNKNPALDKAIAVKQQQVIGGAIEGLNLFKDISDPFARRALAEKYQGGLNIELGSLTSERDRRQGKLEDYITKWAGVYGAEATRQLGYAQLAENAYDREKGLAAVAEENRRWEIEQAQKKADKASTGMKDSEVIAYINANKGSKSWQQMADELAAKGVNVGSRSVADNELRRVNNLAPLAEEKETTTLDQDREEYSSIRAFYQQLLAAGREKEAEKWREQYDWAFK